MFFLLLHLKNNIKLIYLVILVVFIFLFTIIYWLLGTNNHFSFNNTNTTQTKLSFLDALYFAMVTQTTIGYGDITPKSQIMRCITICQSILIIISIISGIYD